MPTRRQTAEKWVAAMEADVAIRDGLLDIYGGTTCPCQAVGNRGANVRHGGKCEAVALYRSKHTPKPTACDHDPTKWEDVGVLFGKVTARCGCGEYITAPEEKVDDPKR